MKNNKNRSISLRRVINNDKSLMIFALILAVIIWTITSLNIGTDETKTINVQVPISLSDKLSKQVGMNYYSLQDTVDVSVTISGAKYVIGQVTESDLNIKFDTSSVNRAGEQTIPILVTNKSKTKDFNIVSTYPSSIDAYFDVNEVKTFDIQLNFDKEAVSDGYIYGAPLLSEDKIVVSGPTTYVDKIESVSVNATFDSDADLTETYNGVCDLILNGSGIEQSYLTLTSKTNNSAILSSVSVTIPVLKVKQLPVSVSLENVPKGLKEGDYKLTYSVEKLEAGVLENTDVKSADIGSIDFSQLTVGTNSFDFDISKAQGFTPVDETLDTINVEVEIPEESFEKTIVAINKDDIKLRGGTGEEKIDSLEKSTLIIIAPKGVEITASDVNITCDISKENEDNSYPLSITVSNNSAWVYSTYTVSLETVEE